MRAAGRGARAGPAGPRLQGHDAEAAALAWKSARHWLFLGLILLCRSNENHSAEPVVGVCARRWCRAWPHRACWGSAISPGAVWAAGPAPGLPKNAAMSIGHQPWGCKHRGGYKTTALQTRPACPSSIVEGLLWVQGCKSTHVTAVGSCSLWDKNGGRETLPGGSQRPVHLWDSSRGAVWPRTMSGCSLPPRGGEQRSPWVAGLSCGKGAQPLACGRASWGLDFSMIRDECEVGAHMGTPVGGLAENQDVQNVQSRAWEHGAGRPVAPQLNPKGKAGTFHPQPPSSSPSSAAGLGGSRLGEPC